ncbi:hypothetical protein [Arachnia propionica]|uniref:hypothetical protein n=1 Tax=Arachnia propionica TaxID=1750 RepID=UPI00163B604E|nr:hypothetical protein [Arachnia propionica]
MRSIENSGVVPGMPLSPVAAFPPGSAGPPVGGTGRGTEGDTTIWLRNLANLANLSTPLGLVLAVAFRGRLRRAEGLIWAEHAHVPLPAGAITVGSVVLIPRQGLDDLIAWNPEVVGHESEHAWQYAYCLGLPFIPAYLMTMAWSWLRTGDRAAANHFEVQAGLVEGGYRELPTRPLRDGLRELRRLTSRAVGRVRAAFRRAPRR